MVGIVIRRITGTIPSAGLAGVIDHRLTTTALVEEREAAPLVHRPATEVRLEVREVAHPLGAGVPAVAALVHQQHGHHLVVEVPARVAEVSAHPRLGRRLVEAPVHPGGVLAPHQPGRRLVEAHPLHQAAASEHQGPGDPALSVRLRHPAALAQPVPHLVVAHQALEVAHAPAAVASLVVEAAVAAPVVGSSEAVRAPVEEASSVVEAAGDVPVDLAALEVEDDDRFGLCDWWRLGFDHVT